MMPRLDETCLSDQMLLALLDGELPSSKSRSADFHLARCEICQARRNELQSLLQTYAVAMGGHELLPPHRVEAARRRFLEQAKSNPRGNNRRWTLSAAIALATCTVLALIAFLYPHSQDSRSALLLARAYEQRAIAVTTQPVHQVFSIQVKQSRPIQKKRAGMLDIFSDAAHGRASLRWRDDQDHLRYAVWRPGAGAAYVYDSGSRRPAVIEMPNQKLTATSQSYVDDVTTSDPSVESMESAVQRWIRQTDWEPLLLAETFAVFCKDNHIVPTSATYRDASGHARIALFAEKQVEGRSIRIELLLDKTTDRPLLERVVCADRSRTVELIVSAKRWEFLRSDSAKTRTWFNPDSSLSPKTLPRITMKPSRPITRSSGLPPPPDKRVLDELQIQTLYALHRIGACLGDPISVEQSDQSILVNGLLDSAERRKQIAEALAGLSGTAYLQILLKTVEEVLASKTAPSPEQTSEPASRFNVRMRTAALDSVLLQIFKPVGDPALAATKRTELANEALSRSATLLANAWAFRHLNESFSQAPPANLESQVLIENMTRDHLKEIVELSTALERQFTPIFQTEHITDPTSKGGSPEKETNQPVLPVFGEATQIDRDLHLLLSDPRPLQEDQVRDLLLQLRTSLRALSLDANKSTGPASITSKK